MCIFLSGKAIPTQQCPEIIFPERNILQPENDPPNHDEDDCIAMLQPGGYLFQHFAQEARLNGKNQTKVSAPDDKIPGSSMPQTGKQEHNQQIRLLS